MENTKFNLWHYTTLDGLKGILSSQTLWATHYRCLNDSSEFFHSKSIICQEVLPKVICMIENECKKNSEAKKVAETYGGINNIAKIEINEIINNIIFEALLNSPGLPQTPFVASFCKAHEDDISLQENGLLSQWRGYGKDGGYAVIFDMEKIINEFAKEESSFYHGIANHGDIVYEPDRLTMNDNMKKSLEIISNHVYRIYKFVLYREPLIPATAEELSSLFYCMTLLKHKGFKEETEYRFCVMSYGKEAKRNQYFVEDKSKSFKEIMTRNNEGTPVPYIKLFERSSKLPIKKICIGPHHDKELRVKLMNVYLKSIGLDYIKVICSEIPYIGSMGEASI